MSSVPHSNDIATSTGSQLGSIVAPRFPRRELLFEPVRDRYGWRLALVFGNHALAGSCPYYLSSRCHHCDIGAGEGRAFDHQTNRARWTWFQSHYNKVLRNVAHLVLYNSGSILNPREMPTDLLVEILNSFTALPCLRVVSLDTREAYIKTATLDRVAEILGPGRTLRPILGLESSDDRIRNGLLEKQMPMSAVVRAFKAIGEVEAKIGAGRVAIDVNIVLAGPGTTPVTAVGDAVATAQFAIQCGHENGVAVDLNLHPYYPSARGIERFPNHGRCPLSIAVRAVEEIAVLCQRIEPSAVIFIGWQDEGHDREPELRVRELLVAREAFDTFNQTGDPVVLRNSLSPIAL